MLLEGELNQLLAVSPKFGGSTGGWLQAAETEEKYAITWASKKEQIFEMPTSGAAIMQKGVNYVLFLKLTIIKFIVFFQIVMFSIYILGMVYSQRK